MKRPVRVTWDQLRVGGLVLAALALLVYAILRLGTAMHLFSDRYSIVTLLPSASGLRVGGAVSVAGQPAGTIARIEFLPIDDDTTRNLLVVMDVDIRVQQQIRRDSRAHIRTLGLLGDKTLDITPGTPSSPMLGPGDTLLSTAVLDYDRLLLRAADAVDDFVALTGDLRSITSGLASGEGTLGLLLTDRRVYDELHGALRRSNAVLVRLQRPDGTFARLVDDPTLYNQLLGAVQTVDSVARYFAEDRGTIGRLLSDSTVYVTLSSVANQADSLLKALGRGEGTLGRLLAEEQVYDQLLRNVGELTSILEDFRRNPSRYMRGVIRIF